MTDPIPRDQTQVAPYLLVSDVDEMLHFLYEVFGAQIEHALVEEGSDVKNHAQVRIGNSTVMLGKSSPEFSMAGMIHVYVEDCDATYQRAVQLGAATIMEPSDQFYGDRAAGVTGPFQNAWWIASRMVDYSPDELQKRSVEEHRRRNTESGD